MATVRVSVETVFLRNFAEHYVSEIALTRQGLVDMAAGKIGLGDVLHLLRTGRVSFTNKDGADGARWVVEGFTCHGRAMRASLHVWCDRYCVRVLRVFVGEGVGDV